MTNTTIGLRKGHNVRIRKPIDLVGNNPDLADRH